MSKKRYVVELSAVERKRREELIRKGKSPAKKQLKARILLRANESPLGRGTIQKFPKHWAHIR